MSFAGGEACRRIKDAPGLRSIPVLLLTALEDRAAMIQGLAGAPGGYGFFPDNNAARRRAISSLQMDTGFRQ